LASPRRRLGTFDLDRVPPTAVLWLVLLAAAVVLLYAGRHLSFFYDEWDFVELRRGGGIDTYLGPHNGHLSLLPVLVYKALFKLVGLRHYTLYRAVGVAVHLVCASLLYVLARRRVGPWLALLPTTLLLFMGSAYQDLLWPFQIGYLGSIATGLGAFALLDDPARRSDGWVAVLLVCGVASSGVGVCFLLGSAMMLIAQRAPWRCLWVAALPAVLYVAWSVHWGTDTTTSKAIAGAPHYVARAAAGAVAGMAGRLATGWRAPLAIALVVALVLVWFWRRRPPTPMLLAALAGGLSFWVLTAITRATIDEPAATRYLYVGAVFVWLILVESAAGLRLRPVWIALGVLVVAGALEGNVKTLRAEARALAQVDTSVRAALTSVEIAAPVVDPAFKPAPVDAPPVTAGTYLAAVRDLGSPAYNVSELERQPESTRAQADRVLARAEVIVPAPIPPSVSPAAPPAISSVSGGRVMPAGSCERYDPGPGPGHVDLVTRPGGALLLRASAPAGSVSVRRFSSEFARVPTGSGSRPGMLIRFPADRAPGVPWHVRVAAQRPMSLCGR
jgi:hypothetical protein